jgi:hypothetical protein
MQAMVRGRQARKVQGPRLQKHKEEIEMKRKKFHQDRKSAARKRLSKKRERSRQEKQRNRETAAIKLQALERGRSTRRRERKIEEEVQRRFEQMNNQGMGRRQQEQRRSPKSRLDSSNRVNNSPKRRTNRTKLQQRFDEEDRKEAIITLQAANRGRRIRREMREKREAASKIQAGFRGMHDRKKVQKIKRKRERRKKARPINIDASPRGSPRGSPRSPRDRNQKISKQGLDGPSPRRRGSSGNQGEQRTLRIPPPSRNVLVGNKKSEFSVSSKPIALQRSRPNYNNWLDDLEAVHETLLPDEPTPLELVMADRSIIPPNQSRYELPVSFAQQKNMPSVPKSIAVPGMHWSHVYAPIDDNNSASPEARGRVGAKKQRTKGRNMNTNGNGRNTKELKRLPQTKRNQNSYNKNQNNTKRRFPERQRKKIKPANGYNPESPKKWAEQQSKLQQQQEKWEDKWQTEWLQWLNWHNQQEKRNVGSDGGNDVHRPEVSDSKPTDKKKKYRRKGAGPETSNAIVNRGQTFEQQKKMLERAMQRQALEITRNQQYNTPEYIPPPMVKVGSHHQYTRSPPISQQQSPKQQRQKQPGYKKSLDTRRYQGNNNYKRRPVPRKPSEENRNRGLGNNSPRNKSIEKSSQYSKNSMKKKPTQKDTSSKPWRSQAKVTKTSRRIQQERFLDNAANLLLKEMLPNDETPPIYVNT